jgi:hypothetical protein
VAVTANAATDATEALISKNVTTIFTGKCDSKRGGESAQPALQCVPQSVDGGGSERRRRVNAATATAEIATNAADKDAIATATIATDATVVCVIYTTERTDERYAHDNVATVPTKRATALHCTRALPLSDASFIFLLSSSDNGDTAVVITIVVIVVIVAIVAAAVNDVQYHWQQATCEFASCSSTVISIGFHSGAIIGAYCGTQRR